MVILTSRSADRKTILIRLISAEAVVYLNGSTGATPKHSRAAPATELGDWFGAVDEAGEQDEEVQHFRNEERLRLHDFGTGPMD